MDKYNNTSALCCELVFADARPVCLYVTLTVETYALCVHDFDREKCIQYHIRKKN